MNCDILIRGGRVIDPAVNRDEIGDIAIYNGKIGPLPTPGDTVSEVIDATGCLVLPGLIDFHGHVFFRGTENSVAPDSAFLPYGVTTVVDGGSAGTANFEVFQQAVVNHSLMRICSFVNVSPTGQTTNRYDENLDPDCFDADKIGQLLEQYQGTLRGIKLRHSRGIVKEFGMAPLKKTLAIAERFDCPIMVHATNPPNDTSDLADLLRSGDIFAHMYHGTGSTILTETGNIKAAVQSARDRGVLFDVAHGRTNFTFATARQALAAGFEPDIISSDTTPLTLYRPPAMGLPFLLSKFLAMGLSLTELVRTCTATPATALGLNGKIGTLAPEAYADVAIYRLTKEAVTFSDFKGELLLGESVLVPQLTLLGGRLVYRHITFNV
ncbi:MAG: metallo-dependent hydrolase [Sporomusaceae bacterium]|nr:metallo-dependent hydrolase [Sporomusaceae bacterium]